jgi:hypothetical protein
MTLQEKKLKIDSRGRINIKQLAQKEVTSFRAFKQEDGSIVLKPVVEIEIHLEEAWIFKNPEAKAMIEEGLEDFKAGRVSELDESFWDEIDDMEDEEE